MTDQHRTERLGRWTVYRTSGGAFGHARHDDRQIQLVWSLDELRSIDPRAAARWETQR